MKKKPSLRSAAKKILQDARYDLHLGTVTHSNGGITSLMRIVRELEVFFQRLPYHPLPPL